MHRTGNFLKRKIFFVILISIAIAALAFGISACGKGDVSSTSSESGPTGNGNAKDLEYVQRGDEYVVSGIGSYSGTDLVIPSEYKGLPVTAIDDYAFFNNKTLNSVFLPESITYIGGYSFYYCKTLTKVNIPENTIFLGECAFYNCTALEEIYYNATALDNFTATKRVFDMAGIDGSGITVMIGVGVTEIPAYLFCPDSSDSGNIPKITSIEFEDDSRCTSIGVSAFYNCKYLKSLTLPENLLSIGSSAFYNCSSLETFYYDIVSFTGTLSSYLSNAGRDGDGIAVTIGKSVIAIPDSLFSSFTKITDVVFEDEGKCTSIGAQAFSGCTALVSISVPNTVTNIGDSAFNNCSSLSNLTIGSGVTSIGDRAFYNCTSLTSVAIPDNVVLLGEYAFYGCTSLATVEMGSKITSIGQSAFYNCSSLKSIIIPDGVTEITSNLFYNCTSLSSVEIGAKTTTVGYRSFYCCTSLESIEMPDSVTSVGESAFEGCSSLGNIVLPAELTSVANRTFYDCTSLTSVDLPDGVTSIGNYSFYNCSLLKDVDMSKNLTSIGSYAFYGCSSILGITIPEKVISIGDHTFYECIALENIFYNAEYMNDLSANNYVFYNAGQSGNGITVIIGEKVARIPACLFYDSSYAVPKITTLIFEEISQCSSIGENAFGRCSYLTGVYVTDFASWCSLIFENADANPLYYAGDLYVNNELQTSLPDGLITINNYAFCGWNTDTVSIPDSVISIGNYAFYYCTSLTSLTIGCGVTSIGIHAFYGCTALNEIKLNAVSLLDFSSNNYVFADAGRSNTGIRLTIGADVTKIPAYMFCPYSGNSSYAPQITTVIFEEGSQCKSIGTYAFYNCIYLESLMLGDALESIATYAFYGCVSLGEINFNAVDMDDFSSTNYVFYNAGQSASGITLTIGAQVVNIPAYIFYPYNSSSCIPKISTIIFEENSQCLSIGNYAFYNARTLTEIKFNAIAMDDFSSNNYVFYNAGNSGGGIIVTIGACVTKIPAYIFYPYSSNSNFSPKITDLVFEEGSQCMSIGTYAFYYCVSLSAITIPESIVSIGSHAFSNCTGLEYIYFNATAMDDLSDSNYVFYSAGKSGDGITMTVGSNVTKIPAYLFYPGWNTSSFSPKISTIIFEPNSQCTSIGTYAFFYAGTYLKTVYYSGSSSDWSKISIESNNSPLTSATIYYYSEYEPTEDGDFWRYVDGEISIWQ